MKIIDTHIHIDKYFNIHSNAYANIVPSITFGEWKHVEKLYIKSPKSIIPAFGIHPWYVNETPNNWAEVLEEMIIKYPNALIGETGLDRHRDKEYSPQNEFFKKHIELAKKYKRPVIIHAVKCVDWLDEYWQRLSEVRFVFHSFNARRELLKKIINAGGYVSVSASMLNNREKEKILPAIPLDKIMIETDGPYQKGDINNIANEVAQILGLEYEEFLRIVYDNTREFLTVK